MGSLLQKFQKFSNGSRNTGIK